MRVRHALACAAVLVACGNSSRSGSGAGSAAPVPTGPLPEVAKPKPPPPAAFPAGTLSLRLTKSTGVFLRPDGVDRIGNIAADTRVAWVGTEKGKGCAEPWVQIRPRGWVCGEQLEASTKPPLAYEMPRLDRAEIVPGTYGKIIEAGATTYELNDPSTKKKKPAPKPAAKPAAPKPAPKVADAPASTPGDADDAGPAEPPKVDPLGRTMTPGRPLVGSLNVRRYAEISIAGKDYWKVDPRLNEYVLRSSVSQHRPSTYRGARLADDTGLTLPIAFVWPKTGTKVWTRGSATGGGGKQQVSQRDALPVLETHAGSDGKPAAYRVGDGEWIDAEAVRVAELTEPPPLIGPAERWVDVDLDRQLLVAYEGKLPVYATMISSGKSDTPTAPGIYRIMKKLFETDMNGLTGEDAYSVSTVPWTQFFSNDGLALHTSYWHDKFGLPRSHGCINLAPKDARWMYFWSEPQVPGGWTMVASVVELPGSIVRVRSKSAPTPLPYIGYVAKRVQELRQAQGHP